MKNSLRLFPAPTRPAFLGQKARSLKLLPFAFCLLPSLLFSQEKRAASDLLLAETAIGEAVGFQYQSKVDGKLAQVFGHGRAAAMPNYNAFVVVPSLEKTGERPVDSLPGSIEVEFRLRLAVKNAITNKVLVAHDIKLAGSGRQQSEAAVRAISSIRLTNRDLHWATDHVRQDIRDYFLTKTDSVMLDLQKLLANKQFGEAFVLANSVPADAPRAEEFSKLKETAFAGYQEQLCQTLTSRVEAALASPEAAAQARAAEILATASPDGPCAADLRPRLEGIKPRLPEPSQGNYAWFFDAFSSPLGAKGARPLTESAITSEVLTGDGARMRFAKPGL